jgi:hypothetical protein
MAKPTSCTIRSRAKREAVSTMMARPPFPSMAVQHGGEAGPGLDGIGAAHGGIVILRDNLAAGGLCEPLDGDPLALIAILVHPDAARA